MQAGDGSIPLSSSMINIIMKVIDLIEAISLGQHEPEIEQLIKKGLISALNHVSTLKGSDWLKKADKAVAKGEFREMGNQLRPQVKAAIEGSLAYTLKTGLGKQFHIDQVGFEDMGSPAAYAQDQDIMINTRWTDIVSRALVESLFDTVMNNYSEEQFVDAVYFVPKMIASGDRAFTSAVFDNTKIQHQTSKLASTLVHELVHIMQHTAQQHRDDTEYRSYLDAHKGEFAAMHDKRMAGQAVPDEDTRYWNLYLSSPQEIPAFSHQIALKIINDSGVKGAKTIEELNQLAGAVDAHWIMDAIREKLHGRFQDPKNQKEYAVLKRYMKLTYTEFAQYVRHIRAQLEQRLSNQEQF